MSERPTLFVTAGEPSGDRLGGALLRAMAARRPFRFVGVGGPEMQAAGLETLFPLEDLAVMGLAEVLPRLPLLLRRIDQTAAAVRATRPAALVTIDAPDFSFRVAKRVGPLLPRLHYVAPTVWAWRSGRAAKVARLYDLLLALLPFEPPWFERAGLACRFVGHPVAGEPPPAPEDGLALRGRLGIDPLRPVLVLLPGSRRGEVARLLPLMVAVAGRLRAAHPDLAVLLPTLPHLRAQVAEGLAGARLTITLLDTPAERDAAFAAGTVALAASGSVTLELARAGLPHVVTYRVNPLTFAIARHLIRVPSVNLVNLVTEEMLVPEFLQGDATPAALTLALDRLLRDPEARSAQRAHAARALAALGAGGPPPAERAADAVLGALTTSAAPGA